MIDDEPDDYICQDCGAELLCNDGYDLCRRCSNPEDFMDRGIDPDPDDADWPEVCSECGCDVYDADGMSPAVCDWCYSEMGMG